MASTYTSGLRIEKIATGEQSGTWGATTNTQYDLWEAAVSGTSTVAWASDADDTLTTANGSADEARNMFLNFTGGATLTTTRNMVVPTVSKLYFVRNNTTGGQSIVVKTSAGTGITVPTTRYMALYCDGTNVVDAVTYFTALATASAIITGGTITGITDLVVADGGTGASTLTDGGILLGSGTDPVTALAAMADGEMVVGDGTTDPVLESGATLRTSIGVAIGSDVQAYDAGISTTPLTQGVHTIWIPAPAETPRETAGSAATAVVETSTNKVNLNTLDFDASTIEYAQTWIYMPKSYDGGTITAIPVWKHAATTTNFKVSWGIQAVAFADGDAADTAFGTAIYSDDTGGTTNDIYYGPETAAVTIGGSPAGERLTCFQMSRKADDGTNDTLAIDAGLLGWTVLYTINAGNDA